jgi:uncharacterized membrane protein YeaQ/YmgE (transglycosylase-associated protein family)
MFGLLWSIVIGLVVGIMAKAIMPGRDPGGFIITAVLGIAGSFVGTFVGRMFFGRYYSAGFIMSVLGAIALLAIYRMIKGQRST